MKKYLSKITSLLLAVVIMLSCSIISMSAATEYTQNNDHGVNYDYAKKGTVNFVAGDYVFYGSSGSAWGTHWLYCNGNLATCARSSRDTPTTGTYSLTKYYLANDTMRAKTFYWYFVNPSARLANNASKYNSSCSTYTDNLEAAMSDIKKKSPSATVTKYALAHTLIDSLQQNWNNDDNGKAWNEVLDDLNPLSDYFPSVPGNIKVYYCYPGGGSAQSVMSYEYHPVVEIRKVSDTPLTTDGNKNYSFEGITYVFSTSKTDFDINGSHYLGAVDLDKNGVATTEKGSRATLRELDPGTYYVKEYDNTALRKSGYQYNDTVYTVKVTSENTLSNPAVLRVSDPPVKPVLKIEKFSTKPELTDGNSHYTFKGITYCLYKSTKSFVTGSSNPDYVGYIELSEDGTGFSYDGSNETIRNLGIGTYYAKEYNNEALEQSGYKLDETVYTVTLNKDNTREDPFILRVSDEPEGTISAKIIKKSSDPEMTDGNNCYTLQGAKFNLYENELDAINNTNPFMTDLETDENGVAHISDLPDPGESGKTYYVREIVAPSGYALSDEIGELNVSADEEAVNMVEMFNPPQNDPVRILLKKEDEQTGAVGKRIEGAEFTVKYYRDYFSTEEECLSSQPDRTWVVRTDADGYTGLLDDYLVSGDEFYYDSFGNPNPVLPLGTVYIKESKAPIGYKLSTDAYIQQITSEGDLDKVDTYNAPVIREPRAGIVNISGVKKWEDDDDRDGKRPKSLTIDLLRNGEVIDSYVTDETQDWSFEFLDLPEGYGDLLADNDIHYFTYSVKESNVPGYKSTGGDLVELSTETDEWNVTTHNYEVTFTNTYTPEKIEIEGKKIWDDYDDTFGLRPGEITITLLMNGKSYRSVKTDASKSWKFSFDNLDKYYDHGELIRYSVLETDVNNYTSTISENTEPGDSIPYFSVINVLKTGKVTMSKVDENGQPLANVKFKLYREADKMLITCSLIDGTYVFDPDGSEVEYVTDADGLIQIEGLPVGDYVFEELETVEGYMPYSDPIPFSLIEEDDVISGQLVSVSNHRAVMYNTGGVGNTVFYAIAIGTAVAAAVIILAVVISKKRKQKKQE